MGQDPPAIFHTKEGFKPRLCPRQGWIFGCAIKSYCWLLVLELRELWTRNVHRMRQDVTSSSRTVWNDACNSCVIIWFDGKDSTKQQLRFKDYRYHLARRCKKGTSSWSKFNKCNMLIKIVILLKALNHHSFIFLRRGQSNKSITWGIWIPVCNQLYRTWDAEGLGCSCLPASAGKDLRGSLALLCQILGSLILQTFSILCIFKGCS